MSGRAKVTSLDALDRLTAALRIFQHEVARSLESVGMNVRAATDWVVLERKSYWNHQLRRSEQKTHEAKLNLQRCQTFKRVDDYRPSCIEEKRALERARRRLAQCHEKVKAVEHWARVISQAVYEYEGGVSQLARWQESDADRAVAVLDRLRRTLEAYAASSSTANPSPVAGNSLPPDDSSRKDNPAGEPPSIGTATQSKEENGK